METSSANIHEKTVSEAKPEFFSFRTSLKVSLARPSLFFNTEQPLLGRLSCNVFK